MKDFLRRACVVVRTSNMKNLCRRLADYVKKNCTKKRAARAARLFFLIQPFKLLICGVIVAVPDSLSGSLRNDDGNGNDNATNQ